MIRIDSEALECDLAETYHILNMRELSPSRIALFSVGLRENSRIKKKLCNMQTDFNMIINASISDKLSIIISMLAGKDSQKPVLLVDKLIKSEKNAESVGFDSGVDFLEYRNKLINKMEGE